MWIDLNTGLLDKANQVPSPNWDARPAGIGRGRVSDTRDQLTTPALWK